MAQIAVEMCNITKIFPGMYRSIIANDRVDLSVGDGKFHVIVGENGAGKSTLMNVLYGLLEPDEGEVRLFGDTVKLASPKIALEHGIGMIHQHFMLVPSFTIGENIVLGSEPTRVTLLDRRRIRQAVNVLAEELKLEVDPDTPIWDTTVGVQQRVEILKALYRGARILILDEPTAVLTPQEVDILFKALKKLAAGGTTIIMITHKLPEVVAVADHVTVMRDGAIVGRVAREDLDERDLAHLMTGRPWDQTRIDRTPTKKNGKSVFKVSELHCLDERGLPAVRGVTFEVMEGEILAVAGVAHNGQEELAEAIMGQRPIQSGTISFDGNDINELGVRARRGLGIGHIPDDRYGEGCAREATVSKNMIMAAHNKPPLGSKFMIDLKEMKRKVAEMIEGYDIRLDHPDEPIMSLSGGNVQKAIVAREMSMSSRLIVAEQPSRGIDIGAAELIYERLIALRNQGIAVLLISMDLTEVLRLSDRILVIFNGSIVGERIPEDTNQSDLGLLMAGLEA